MSIRDSKRLRLSLAAVGAAGLIYLGWTVSLQALAHEAEATGEVYPFRDEDWLRYLLPTLWPDDGKPLLLLTGPSAVRENLLVEEFGSAFPEHRTFQGGLSLGTLADVMASLDYIERTHGTGALPTIMVLGVSPRFLAEIPHSRPFAQGLDRYSRHYRVPARDPDGFGLEAKTGLVGIRDQARFLTQKQTRRYQAAIAWLVATIVGPDLSMSLARSRAARFVMQPLRLIASGRPLDIGIHDFAMEVASPYKYRDMDPYPVEGLTAWLDDPDSWWKDVYRWDPAEDEAVIRARVVALLAFAARHGIDLYVVNLPDRGLSRARYGAGLSDRYIALLDSTFETVPFLDLRCLLEDDEYLDAEHALLPGARRVTERVIGFMNEVRAGRASAGRSWTGTVPHIADRWAASTCQATP